MMKSVDELLKNLARKPIKIKIKYHNNNITKMEKFDHGDWVDLRSAETVTLRKGEFKYINLGVSMHLPEGYEAHVVPRSSTFKNFKVIQSNSYGIIDYQYNGDSDVWHFPAYAVKDTVINENDRICQFRIVEVQPDIEFEEVESLKNESRGGLGSTGVN